MTLEEFVEKITKIKQDSKNKNVYINDLHNENKKIEDIVDCGVWVEIRICQ